MISSEIFNRVVVIWGPPGVGKTALVQKVYSQFVLDRSSTLRPFVLCGWVQVSGPFTLTGFSRSLLSVLRPRLNDAPDPIRECSDLLRDHSCLVVIDGLQSRDNFSELARAGLIYGHPKSCIVLVTTEKSVTTCIAPILINDPSLHGIVPLPYTPPVQPETDPVYQVKPLDRWSARKLFKQVYGQPQGRPSSSTISDHLMDKCGFPTVILAVTKYLSRGPPDAVTQFEAAVKNGKFIHELATIPRIDFVGLKGLLAWVDSDLKACPESLKSLVMYMLNFSQEEGVVVRRKRLVRRWIAEGYIKNTGICDMVTEAEERVGELQDLTMTMQVPQGRVSRSAGGQITWHRGCQLSALSGEVLMSRAAEDPLFLPLEVSVLTQGKRSLTSRGCAGRHLRIDAEWKGSEFVFRSLDLSRLRSLTVFGKFEAYFINDSMKVLRVLDLEDATIAVNDDIKEIPKILPRLRFLSLRGCRHIDRLPDSIGDLRLLQTLDIRRTMITKLPDSIIKLRKLQCLRAGHSMKALTKGDSYTPWWTRMSRRLHGLTLSDYGSQGVTMPRGMSRLTALHTLGIVNVNTPGGEAILEELRDLKQLRKVELYGINSYNVQGLSHLPSSLDSLSLEFTKGRGYATKKRMRSGLSLLSTKSGCRLKLHGHVDILQTLPFYIKVTDLTLEIDTSLTQDDMERIGLLDLVRTLRLHFHTQEDEEGNNQLKFDANNCDFPELEVLEISTDSRLDVELAPGAVGTLKVLKFVGSGHINIPPRGLHHLLSLKEVWVPQFLRREMSREVLVRHPTNPTIIDFNSWQYLRDPEAGESSTM